MTADGIGVAVRRKEDRRFLTGTGRYTDDIDRFGQVYACFVRSPYAHASVDSIDTASALGMPGVLAVFTGADVTADGLGPLPAGWMIHSKDGSPMKTPGHPLLVVDRARYVGEAVAVVIAETYAQARDAADRALELDPRLDQARRLLQELAERR